MVPDMHGCMLESKEPLLAALRTPEPEPRKPPAAPFSAETAGRRIFKLGYF